MVKRSLLNAQKNSKRAKMCGLVFKSRTGNNKGGQISKPNEKPQNSCKKQNQVTTVGKTQNTRKRKQCEKQKVLSAGPKSGVSTDFERSAKRQKVQQECNKLLTDVFGSEQNVARKRQIYANRQFETVVNETDSFDMSVLQADRNRRQFAEMQNEIADLDQQIAHIKSTKQQISLLPALQASRENLVRRTLQQRHNKLDPHKVLSNIAKYAEIDHLAQQKEDNKVKNDCKQALQNDKKCSDDSAYAFASTAILTNKRRFEQHVNAKSRSFVENEHDKTFKHLVNAQSNMQVELARIFVNNYGSDALQLYLANKNNSTAEQENDDDGDEYDEDDEDLFDDTRRNQWLEAHSNELEQDSTSATSTGKYWHQYTLPCKNRKKKCTSDSPNGQNRAENAPKTCKSVPSLLQFDNWRHYVDKLDQSSSGPGKTGVTSKQELERVRVGDIQRGQAFTGKDRNKVQNKMKPVRNEYNLSVFNFIQVTKRQTSAKAINRKKFLEFVHGFMQNNGNATFESGEKNIDDTGGAKSAASNNIDQSNAVPNKVIAQPSYNDPRCEKCGHKVRISSRSNIESCLSPSCGHAVHHGTGYEIVHLEQIKHNSYQYLLVVHMKTTLRRVQAKENALIPRRVLTAVKNQIETERIPLAYQTPSLVKNMLKKLNLTPWYNHRYKICWRITGVRPHQFTSDEENIILAVFERLIQPYNQVQDNPDENFYYYQYALHKILQLLGYPRSIANQYAILKQRKNHMKKEQLWKRMVSVQGWPFIETKFLSTSNEY